MASLLPPERPTIPAGLSADMSHETEKLLTCPYNSAHTILRYRMQTHLHKCRKQHESLEWVKCCFNSTHHMPPSELEWHQKYMCPDRHSFFAKTVEFDAPSSSLAPIEHIDLPVPGENWDDGEVNYFNPSANAEMRSLIRGIHCVPPAERKAFKSAHRRHIQDNAEDVVTSARLTTGPRNQQREERQEVVESVRPPKELPRGYTGPDSQGRTPTPGQLSSSSSVAPQNVQGRTPTPGQLSSSSSVAPQNVQWTGYGRGRVFNPPPPAPGPSVQTAAPSPGGAWGRGRPNV